MDVKKIDTQTNTPLTPTTTGAPPQAGTAATTKLAANTPASGTNAGTKLSPSDLVTLSQNSVKESQLSTLMGGFQKSIVDTLSTHNANPGMNSLYSLTGTPVDDFMNKNLTKLTPDMKKSFMDNYTKLAKTSGGLVPQSLLSQSFGQTGGLSEFLTSLTNRLNQLPTNVATSGNFPGTGGTSTIG